MGVKNFYLGFKTTFSNCITKETDIETYDTLIIELNGLFYSACRKLHHSEDNLKLLKRNKLNLKLFEEISEQLDGIITKYNPNKNIYLVVDGTAAMMKNLEQRQRRYKNSLENKYDNIFDLNSFSPGTKMLNFLTKYIDWFIRYKMNTDELYQKLNIYFSNEKVEGEGEYKILRFIKKICEKNSHILIYTCDSDMILLSMIHNEYNIIIIRNSSLYGQEYVNIEKCRQRLLNNFYFSKAKSEEKVIKDLFILFSLLGNDYISSSPCIFNFNILYFDILPLYKMNEKHFLHDDGTLNVYELCNFFKLISSYEKKWLTNKYQEQYSYFPDPIYLQNMSSNNDFNFSEYKETYKKNNLLQKEDTVLYLLNIQNIVDMATTQDFNWYFFYPCYKSPFLSDFEYTKDIEFNFKELLEKNKTTNNVTRDCFFHLITILPPQSKYLLPNSLQNIFIDLKDYYPSYIEIDLTGKYKIWEGVVKLPMINIDIFSNYYIRKKIHFTDEEHKRNIHGKTFFYTKTVTKNVFQSFYGKIKNNIITCEIIDI
jgi:5'-3' exonuclease